MFLYCHIFLLKRCRFPFSIFSLFLTLHKCNFVWAEVAMKHGKGRAKPAPWIHNSYLVINSALYKYIAMIHYGWTCCFLYEVKHVIRYHFCYKQVYCHFYNPNVVWSARAKNWAKCGWSHLQVANESISWLSLPRRENIGRNGRLFNSWFCNFLMIT